MLGGEVTSLFQAIQIATQRFKGGGNGAIVQSASYRSVVRGNDPSLYWRR
jgi:hypothetical protein